jgi:exosome complex RNA-binding protein Rrp4
MHQLILKRSFATPQSGVAQDDNVVWLVSRISKSDSYFTPIKSGVPDQLSWGYLSAKKVKNLWKKLRKCLDSVDIIVYKAL